MAQNLQDDSNSRPDDYIPQNSYQDDLDTKGVDRATHEETDDPVEGFGVPAKEFRRELNRIDNVTTGDEDPEDTEDMREHIEDMDEDDKDND